MKLKLNFRKLYVRASEEGIATPDAVVRYGKRPYEQKYHEPDMLNPKGWTEIRYQHRMIVDLWFAKLHFDWMDEWEEK